LLGGAHFSSSSSGISGLLLSGLFRSKYLPYSKKNPSDGYQSGQQPILIRSLTLGETLLEEHIFPC
jgi:hypothetical protein